MDCCSAVPSLLPPNSNAAALASPCAGGIIPSACAPPSYRAYHIATVPRVRDRANLITGRAGMLPNYAMQRSSLVVTPLAHGASGSYRLEQQAARRLRAAADRWR